MLQFFGFAITVEKSSFTHRPNLRGRSRSDPLTSPENEHNSGTNERGTVWRCP
jgi:hypothetical protein